jgi:hypothetical protein
MAVAIALVALTSASAAAQSTTTPLPAPPGDYLEERQGEVQWVFPAAAYGTVADLQETLTTSWSAIVRDLGGHIPSELTVRVGRNSDEMRALAPAGRQPPRYAAGVAYPDLGLILLTLTSPDTGKRPDVATVLVHELSHIALHRAVQGNPMPRWFVEGLAIHHAAESSLARTRVLWEATVQDRLIPLSELDRRFPSHHAEVNIAYAQATSLVTYLLNEDGGPERFRQLVAQLREGTAFEAGLLQSYGVSLQGLERAWRAELRQRYRTLPLLFGGGTLWVLITLLMFVAYGRYKRRASKKLARWAAEEAAADRAENAIVQKLAPRPQAPAAVPPPPPPPQARDGEIPTVRWEGRNHTLH